MESSKAGATGDVCCICLETMSIRNLKKVGCGNLFHANCIREVVERARSIEAATRCPLYRASLIDGKQVCCQTQQNNVLPFPFFFSPTNNDGGQNVVDGAIKSVNHNIIFGEFVMLPPSNWLRMNNFIKTSPNHPSMIQCNDINPPRPNPTRGKEQSTLRTQSIGEINVLKWCKIAWHEMI